MKYINEKKHKYIICRECVRQRNKRRKKRESDNISREAVKNSRLKSKLEALRTYSPNLECSICHENMIEFLAIDHINGDGATHRKTTGLSSGIQFYYWLARNDFPGDFQILCFNCNMAKSSYGSCPHTKFLSQYPLIASKT
jgi:hypothetical protein